MALQSVSIALTGSGGAGVMTAGQILVDAAAKAGWYGLMARSLGPQIRGGESAALLRLSVEPVQSMGDHYDLLVAVDWGNIDRFAAELPLIPTSVVIADPAEGPAPASIMTAKPILTPVPLKELVKAIPDGRLNMVALGLVAALLGVPEEVCRACLSSSLGRKGADALTSSLAALEAGRSAAAGIVGVPRLAPPVINPDQVRWSITGNEATALGALKGGIRFCAAYPITPATEVLEYLAPALPKVGGALIQVEDELASINMCLGASFGGVPSLTATSGPGLSLMTESIGLAVASEIPVVVIDVQRGGPSTGIPTKSEQADLNIALYGLHGDAPHLVTAPVSIADCVFTTQWSVALAEALQAPAIVLTDQAMGQSRVVIDRPNPPPPNTKRVVPALDATGSVAPGYQRYALTPSGISPMAIPGMPGGEYTADGLEHSPRGTPSTQAKHHQEQLDKRLNKLTAYNYGADWAVIEGTGDLAVITWGSVTEPVREACARLAEQGIGVRMIAVRLLFPAQTAQMSAALAGIERVLVVEQSHGGQFYRMLRAFYDLPPVVRALYRPGPLVLRPQEVATELMALAAQQRS